MTVRMSERVRRPNEFGVRSKPGQLFYDVIISRTRASPIRFGMTSLRGSAVRSTPVSTSPTADVGANLQLGGYRMPSLALLQLRALGLNRFDLSVHF